MSQRLGLELILRDVLLSCDPVEEGHLHAAAVPVPVNLHNKVILLARLRINADLLRCWNADAFPLALLAVVGRLHPVDHGLSIKDHGHVFDPISVVNCLIGLIDVVSQFLGDVFGGYHLLPDGRSNHSAKVLAVVFRLVNGYDAGVVLSELDPGGELLAAFGQQLDGAVRHGHVGISLHILHVQENLVVLSCFEVEVAVRLQLWVVLGAQLLFGLDGGLARIKQSGNGK